MNARQFGPAAILIATLLYSDATPTFGQSGGDAKVPARIMPGAGEKKPTPARIIPTSSEKTPARIELSQRRGVQQVGESAAIFERPAVKPNETPLIARGDDFLDAGRTSDAIEQYRKALKINARAVEALVGWCQALIEEERFDEAEAKYAEIFKTNTRNASAHVNIGATFYRAGYIEKAIDEYRKALALDERQPSAHFNLAMAYAHKGDFDLAKRHYLTAVAQRPKFAEAHNNLGLIYEQVEATTDAAESEFLKAIAAQSDYAFAHYNLGRIYEKRGDFDKAIAEFDHALRKRPKFAEAHLNLGNVRLQRSQLKNVPADLDAAVKRFQTAIELRNDFYPLAYENLAIALTLKRDMAGALRAYRTALTQYDWTSVVAFGNLIAALKGEINFVIGNELAQNDNPGNLRLKKSAVKTDAADESAARLARLRENLEDYADIDDAMKKNADVRYCAGVAYYLAGETEDAVAELREAVKLSRGADRDADVLLASLTKSPKS